MVNIDGTADFTPTQHKNISKLKTLQYKDSSKLLQTSGNEVLGEVRKRNHIDNKTYEEHDLGEFPSIFNSKNKQESHSIKRDQEILQVDQNSDIEDSSDDEKLQAQIEKINKELQEGSDYQEFNNDEFNHQIEAEDEEKSSFMSLASSQNNKPIDDDSEDNQSLDFEKVPIIKQGDTKKLPDVVQKEIKPIAL